MCFIFLYLGFVQSQIVVTEKYLVMERYINLLHVHSKMCVHFIWIQCQK